MRFRAYKIVDAENNYKKVEIQDIDYLYKLLVQSPKLEEEEDNYAIMYLKKYDMYILGTFVQSYQKILTKFDENNSSKIEIQLNDTKINDKTWLYINCNESIIYIQSKRYPEYLTRGLMIERLQSILGATVGKGIQFLPTEINYTMEEINEIFDNSFVKRIAFKNMCGLELPAGVQLHNPRKELDEAMIESYNVYSKDKLDSMELRSTKGEKLGKNPIAKIGMILAEEYQEVGVFKELDVLEDGQKETVRLRGNDSKIINITKKQQESTSQVYEMILKNNIKGYIDKDE